MSLPYSEVNDPVMVFLKSTINEAVSLRIYKPTKDRIALWRQEKEESFSDWRIVLIEKNHEKMGDDIPNHSSKRQKTGISGLNNEKKTDSETTATHNYQRSKHLLRLSQYSRKC